MGNTTTHTHYTTSHNASTLHPSTPPESYRTHQPLAQHERSTPAPKTIAQLAPTQHPYPNTIPNRYDQHCQRSFDPDAAFQHLCQHTRHAVPIHQPYCIALDGTTVPHTGNSIPDAHWIPNPTNAPFARGRCKVRAQGVAPLLS